MTDKAKLMVDAMGQTMEDRRNANKVREAANDEAARLWHDPKYRQEFAEILTESILLGFEYETLVNRWIDTENLSITGRSVVREATGLKAFWMARGGRIEQSQMNAYVAEIPRDQIGIHVSEYTDKFLTEFSESAQTLRTLAVQRLDAEVNRRIHTILTEAIPSGSPYYVSAPGLSKAALDNAIRSVQDASRTGEVVIIGRPTMVDQITDFEGYGVETLEEIRQKGVLGTYRGCDIVRLRNFKDEDGTPYLPGNELWVMSRDAGRFAFFGGLQAKEYEELDNWYWHYIARMEVGTAIWHPERARRIIDGNQGA